MLRLALHDGLYSLTTSPLRAEEVDELQRPAINLYAEQLTAVGQSLDVNIGLAPV